MVALGLSGEVNVTTHWAMPNNFDKFDIDYYEIIISLESTTIARYMVQGNQTSDTRVLDLNLGTNYTISIRCTSMCADTSSATTSFIFVPSKY